MFINKIYNICTGKISSNNAQNICQNLTYIQRDARHRDVELLGFEEIAERRFGGWTMGQVNLAKLNHSIVLKYSERPEFDPYAASGKVSFALLEELMATASVIGRA